MGEVRRPRGQLRDAILDATAELIAAREDPAAVAIADVVSAAGCTPPSLYYYFPTKEHLVQAACRRAYDEFAAAVEASLPRGDPRAELVARGHAYLTWATGHPGMYRALFLHRAPAADVGDEPPADPRRSAGLRELIANVERAIGAGVLRDGDALTTAFALWSVVHGVASLAVVNPDVPDDLVRHTLDTTTAALIEHLGPA